jgi:fumarate hydratase class II
MANDIRWLASGPRAGLGELRLPANEPGSSIMPGKVNPTQCEAMVMVCLQVLGADEVVGHAGAQGNFQLNTMRPLVIHNVLGSARRLGDACDKLLRYCIDGLELDEARIAAYVDRSLMLVTALSPVIGYDRAASIAHHAMADDLSLRDAALESGWVDAATYDRVIDPGSMVDGG